MLLDAGGVGANTKMICRYSGRQVSTKPSREMTQFPFGSCFTFPLISQKKKTYFKAGFINYLGAGLLEIIQGALGVVKIYMFIQQVKVEKAINVCGHKCRQIKFLANSKLFGSALKAVSSDKEDRVA